MKYEVELPADVERRLSTTARETGQDVAHLIRMAVARFVDVDVCASTNGHWSNDVEHRRRQLIDRDIAGTIGEAERIELARLDHLANEHFDRVVPPPMEGARGLHKQLLKNRGK